MVSYTYTIDTETTLIRPGVQFPEMVLFQWKGEEPEGLPTVWHATYDSREIYLKVLGNLDGGRRFQGHNIAFDMGVIAARFPDLLPLIFQAYENGQISCTIIREKLLAIAKGKRLPTWDLGFLSRRYPGVRVADKENPWRLRFGELMHTPLEAFPPEALEYARGDVITQKGLYNAQTDAASVWHFQHGGDVLADEGRQCSAAWWLALTAAWGVHTNVGAARKYYEAKAAELEASREELISLGLVRKDGTRNTKLAAELMRAACIEADIEIPLTDGGKVSLSEDSISLVHNPVLTKYAEFGTATTLLSRIQRLFHGDRTPIQPRFDSLLVTGRTSCSQGDTKSEPVPAYGFQLQNPPREPGMRECFVPRPGRWFLAADWSGGELRTWASVCLWLFGVSRMAEVLLAGRDPHVDLGARLRGQSPEWGDAVYRGDLGPEAKKAFKKTERQIAKVGNFGYQGGMGPRTLVVQARAQYGLTLSLEQSTELRDAWRQNWPEHEPYFTHINELVENSGLLRQLKSGRFRGDCTYCQGANSYFQGLLADVAKHAGFRLSKACYVDTRAHLYGSRIWNFAHDEFLFEIPADPYIATVIASEVRSIMVGTSELWMPELTGAHDVEISLMSTAWSKNAEHRIAKTGRYQGCLIPWEWSTDEG